MIRRTSAAALFAAALALLALPVGAMAAGHGRHQRHHHQSRPHAGQIRSITPSVAIPFNWLSTPLAAQPADIRFAPAEQGTITYPTHALNSSDIWGDGPQTLLTASLAGLVANTPVNVIAAQTGKKIVVVGYNVSSNVAGSTVVFQDHAGSPNIFDGCTFAANDHIQVWRGGTPIFITATSAQLDIAITGSSDVVKGSITYYYK